MPELLEALWPGLAVGGSILGAIAFFAVQVSTLRKQQLEIAKLREEIEKLQAERSARDRLIEPASLTEVERYGRTGTRNATAGMVILALALVGLLDVRLRFAELESGSAEKARELAAQAEEIEDLSARNAALAARLEPSPIPTSQPSPSVSATPACAKPCKPGQVCVAGSCVDQATSCSGRCCNGRNDSCWGSKGRCYCDEYCKLANDCCQDYDLRCVSHMRPPDAPRSP